MSEIGIYIHIPFCESKCYYCDFYSGKFSCSENYFNALKNEINSFRTDDEVVSIYFGGGTPSCIESKYIVETLNLIKEKFNVKSDAEITIEANPQSLTFEKLRSYKEAGFNRLSIGVQTTNEKSLVEIGRLSKEKVKNYKKTIKNCLKNAKKVGFSKISADLMLGLCENNKINLIKDILFLSRYCNHISTYMLTLYEHTPLFKMIKNDDNLEKKAIKDYKLTLKLLKLLNFENYEISSFARKKEYSCHNKLYWQGKNYLGFGASAHSHINPFRFNNIPDIEKYINFYSERKNEDVKSHNQIIEDVKNCEIKNYEELNDEMYKEENIMLSLRLKEGIDLSLIQNKQKEIEELKKLKLIKIKDNRLSLTNKGKLLGNSVILKLV